MRPWSALSIAASLVLLMAFTVGWTGYQQKVADRRWCSLLATLGTQSPPPTTERGRVIARQVSQLRRSFECP